MTDRPQRTEAGWGFLEKALHRSALQFLGLETVGDAAEVPQPAPGLRQRHADMPAAALARLTRPRHHRAERHQVAAGVIEHLRRQFLRPVDAGGLALGVI